VSALAIIIARAGSKGLPGKNERLVGGRPMIHWSIDAAREAPSVRAIFVSTDGANIAAAARAAGAAVIDRPPELASDHATVDAAARHAVRTSGEPDEEIVILYGNVPVRPAGLVESALECLRRSGADSVQSYADVGKHHPWWMVSIDQDQRISPHVANRVYRRQDLPPLFIPDGGVIALRRTALMTEVPGEPHAFLGRDRRGIRTRAGEVVDIDDELDLHVADAILNARAAKS